jgi:hypothetical protein
VGYSKDAKMTGQTRMRQLPVLRIISQAYRAPFENAAALLHASWLWLLLMAPIMFLFHWVTWSWLPQPPQAPGIQTSLIAWADCVITLPFLSSIAVAWHRLVLRGELVRFSLRLGSVVWTYFITSLILETVPRIWGVAANILPLPLLLVLWAVSLVLATRMSVILPAVAVQRYDVSWKRVWAATRWNTWRLVYGTVLCAGPLIITGAIFWSVFGSPTVEGRLSYALRETTYVLVGAILGIVEVGFLSFAYRWFFEAGEHEERSYSWWLAGRRQC